MAVSQGHLIANLNAYALLLLLAAVWPLSPGLAQLPEQSSLFSLAQSALDKSGPTALQAPVFAAAQQQPAQPSSSVVSNQVVAPAPTASNKTDVDVYYVTRMIDRFESFTQKHHSLADQFHTSEQERLEAAILQAAEVTDKSLLEVTATSNEESRLEAQNALNEMQNFISTLKQAMGARGGTSTCLDLTCGLRAYCDFSEVVGARCVCDAGYQGDGFVCNPPTVLSPTSLFQVPIPGIGQRSEAPQVADLSIASLGNGKWLAAVYRDIGNFQRGYVMVGKVHQGGATWSHPQGFSGESQAYGAQIKELNGASGRLALAYRDSNRGGSGILLGAALDPTTLEVILGAPKIFARNQARAIALLALPRGHVAVLFPETVVSSSKNVVAASREVSMHGAALLAKMDPSGAAPEIIGKHRFVSGPVARLSAILLSPTTFVVAYRGGSVSTTGSSSGSNSVSAAAHRTEASAIWGQLRGTELVFDPHPVTLDDGQSQLWARDLSLVQDNMFSYVYHSGNERMTKQAIVRVDPATHRMSVVHGPQVVSHGFTSLIGTVRASVAQQSSRTFTFFNDEGAGKAKARLCGVADSGVTQKCRDLKWGDNMIASGSGTPVGDGRLILVSTCPKGMPYYQFVGLLESKMQIGANNMV